MKRRADEGLIMKPLPRKALFVNSLLAGLCLIFLTEAFSQTPFYQGKTITVIVGIAPGGSGDTRIKALLPFLRKYIPGNPTLVKLLSPLSFRVKNMMWNAFSEAPR
jgi:hypothetical protein